jgi:hypothetical protein
MSKRLYFSRAALAVASTLLIAACSSDAPTSPTMASQDQMAAAVAPAIAIQASPLLRNLCYPAISYSVRGCPSGASVSISNSGGGTLNWTTTKSATWLRRSPKSGTAPSTLGIWVDGAGLPPGEYYGRIKIWATGATNSPVSVFVHFTRR